MRPLRRAAPFLPCGHAGSVVVNRRLLHDAVVHALQPVIEEAPSLDRDIEPGLLFDREPIAVPPGAADHLRRAVQRAEQEGGEAELAVRRA